MTSDGFPNNINITTITNWYRVLPGILALSVCAIIAHRVSTIVGVHELLLAIGLGVFLTNILGVPQQLRPGIGTHNFWLAIGIVLLGASIPVDALFDAGRTVLLLVLGMVLLALFLVEAISRNIVGLSEKFGSLLAAGTGICGVSAVVAVGSAAQAKETQIAYATAVVLLVDAITIVVYPILGSFFSLSAPIFGVWAGTSMLSTGPVVAVGFTHSDVAGQWATMTKLARNVLIGIVALGYGIYYARKSGGDSISPSVLWQNFPKFILGFFGLIGLASLGVFTNGQKELMAKAVDWLFLTAFVGLGTEIRLEELKRSGIAPALVVFATISIISVLTLSFSLAVL